MYLEKRLKEKRLEYGFTQEQLGSLLNVSKVSICNWEKGTKKPSTKNLIHISKVLNTPVEYLVGNDVYVVSEENSKFGIMLANEDIAIIEELKKHKQLYEMLSDNPKRALDHIDKKFF